MFQLGPIELNMTGKIRTQIVHPIAYGITLAVRLCALSSQHDLIIDVARGTPRPSTCPLLLSMVLRHYHMVASRMVLPPKLIVLFLCAAAALPPMRVYDGGVLN